MGEDDLVHLRRAIEIAEQGRGAVSPNPLVGAVVVRDGRVLAVGDLARMQAFGAFDLDARYADQVLMPGLVEGHSHLMAGGLW